LTITLGRKKKTQLPGDVTGSRTRTEERNMPTADSGDTGLLEQKARKTEHRKNNRPARHAEIAD